MGQINLTDSLSRAEEYTQYVRVVNSEKNLAIEEGLGN